jgi:hypothetical protein
VKIDRQGESIETDQSLMKEDALIVEIDWLANPGELSEEKEREIDQGKR